MKKSTKVALTLLVPAMTTYGCGSQSKTDQVPTNVAISNSQGSVTIQMKCSCGHSFTVSSDRVGKTAQCPNCNRTLNIPASGTQVNTYRNYYRSNSYYGGWFGGTSAHSAASPPSTQATDANGMSHAASRSSSNGFGGIGAHFSGGS